MPIKVLRLIEYTYDSPERMADDMLRWTMSRKHKGFEMRSAVLQPEWVVDHEAEEVGDAYWFAPAIEFLQSLSSLMGAAFAFHPSFQAWPTSLKVDSSWIYASRGDQNGQMLLSGFRGFYTDRSIT